MGKLEEMFIDIIKTPDPQGGLMFTGVWKVVKWLKSLDDEEQKRILEYIAYQFDYFFAKDIDRKEEGHLVELILVLQNIKRKESLLILNEIVKKKDGYSSLILSQAKGAKEKILNDLIVVKKG